MTVLEWWTEWTTSDLWSRPAESTNVYNRDRTRKFAQTYGDRPIGPSITWWWPSGYVAGVTALRWPHSG